MTEPLIQLKPCPFCGSINIRVEHDDRYFVFCEDCGGSSGYALGNSGACEAWNTRPVEAQLLEACQFAYNQITYLQNLWGKEGVTVGIATAKALAAIAAAEGEP